MADAFGVAGARVANVHTRDYLVMVRREAKQRFDPGMPVEGAARDIKLGAYASWSDAERILPNACDAIRSSGMRRTCRWTCRACSRPWSASAAASPATPACDAVKLVTYVGPASAAPRVGSSLGITSAGIGVGIFLVVPLTQILVDQLGWRVAFRDPLLLGVASAPTERPDSAQRELAWSSRAPLPGSPSARSAPADITLGEALSMERLPSSRLPPRRLRSGSPGTAVRSHAEAAR